MKRPVEPRLAVVVSRKWSEPQIEVHINAEGIRIEMEFSDFVKALAIEVGNPVLIMTNKGLQQKALAAAETVVKGMKAETARVL